MSIAEKIRRQQSVGVRKQQDPYAFSGGRDGAMSYIAMIFPYLRGRSHVLDLGCGQGFLMQELEAAGTRVTGIDNNSEQVRKLDEQKLDVLYWEVFDFLEGHIEANPGEYDAIVASHLIEHFQADEQVELLQLIYDYLPSGGRMVIVTPNMRNPIVAAENFWLDTDHKRPMPLPLLYQLTQHIGFTVVAAGSPWPWQRQRFRSEMDAATHDVPHRSLGRNLQIITHYLRMMIHYGPQLNLLRGDIFFVAEKR
ncbi:MAG: hypothetical protein QG658_32 [Patescibacteria group bacterium]|jgi:2-polyprenyl-3-methyl-5-hydroxy-6-metoxy-1,4-benzoquinol methylase|nr:hypothetical protein [Patescibacteria group bacterium]